MSNVIFLYSILPPQYLHKAEWRISPDVLDVWLSELKKVLAPMGEDYTPEANHDWQCFGIPVKVDDRLAPGTTELLVVFK